ncbi:MAG: response regulator transcription factor [Bradyrhizobium sp.]|uniref:response regulator transcription factor n=1 Tax=Bradyrhizobium sp. TaxID=376 RepID=UPI003D10E336
MPRNAIPRGEIFILDDDTATREALSGTLAASGYEPVFFADSAALLAELRCRAPACIFLEVRLPERAGLDLLKKLHAQGFAAPIFVTSANGDIATAVEAVRSGAVDFIEKPVCGQDVVERMEAAIEESAQPDDDGLPHIAQRLPGCEPFTRREREVLARIAIGETNKEAARKLGLSSRTIEGYRASIMRKVGARNAAELLNRVLRQSRCA